MAIKWPINISFKDAEALFPKQINGFDSYFNKQAVNCELSQAEVFFPMWQSTFTIGHG